VKPYAKPNDNPNNFPAPDLSSPIPAVTKAIIIKGIIKEINADTKELKVTKILMMDSDAKDPNTIPIIIPIINLGTKPSFFFSIKHPPFKIKIRLKHVSYHTDR